MAERSLESGLRVARARGADLAAVLHSLGAERDRYDKAKWRIGGQVISVTGEQYYDHVAGRGGGGAIDLVMHVRGVTFREALTYLDGRALPRVSAPAARPATGDGRSDRATDAPFQAPRPSAEYWPRVRTYLVAERRLPGALVNELHARGLVYADERRNAVFLRRDVAGNATGAALRGTRAGSRFKGLAAGTARDEGWFFFHVGDRGTPQLILTESPIDALSYYGLLHGDCPPAGPGAYREVYVSTDGAGALPHPLIAGALAQGGLVRVGFDRDQTGEQLWGQLHERYVAAAGGDPTRFWREPPPLGKDWNDVLQARIQDHDQDGHGR
jgi:hypothetical protein